jgi:hypothetical protein
MPAPVVVVKDVGGFVTDYQTQTAIYRATGREVRLDECRSACTLALSLPNVCVYPDSTLKFHLAYDPRNHAVNTQVSQQMFGSYPASVQARLGTLTRAYKVLRGDELIALGIRDCNTPKSNEPQIMVASAAAGRPARTAEPGAEKTALCRCVRPDAFCLWRRGFGHNLTHGLFAAPGAGAKGAAWGDTGSAGASGRICGDARSGFFVSS